VLETLNLLFVISTVIAYYEISMEATNGFPQIDHEGHAALLVFRVHA